MPFVLQKKIYFVCMLLYLRVTIERLRWPNLHRPGRACVYCVTKKVGVMITVYLARCCMIDEITGVCHLSSPESSLVH